MFSHGNTSFVAEWRFFADFMIPKSMDFYKGNFMGLLPQRQDFVPLLAQRGALSRSSCARMRPPFSPCGENGPRPVQKTQQEGDFDFPLLHLPPTDTKGRAAALPFGFPSGVGAKVGRSAPHQRVAKRNARRGCRVSASVDGDWLGIFEGLSSKTFCGKLAPSGFSFDRERPFSFRCPEKKTGVQLIPHEWR
jgi:hypothetical protein